MAKVGEDSRPEKKIRRAAARKRSSKTSGPGGAQRCFAVSGMYRWVCGSILTQDPRPKTLDLIIHEITFEEQASSIAASRVVP